MNQLQQLLHDSLIETGHVASCCLVRRHDYSTAAHSVGFSLYPEQIQVLIDSFRNPSQTRQHGVQFNNRKYECIRSDSSAIYARCEEEKDGLVMVRTATFVLIATYADSMFASVCVEACECLADYFREKGK